MPDDILKLNPPLFQKVYGELEAYAEAHGVDVKAKKNADRLQDYAGEIALELNERANKASQNDPIRGLRNGASRSEFAGALNDKNFQLELTETFSKTLKEFAKEKATPTPIKPSTEVLAQVNKLNLENLQYDTATALKGSLPAVEQADKGRT